MDSSGFSHSECYAVTPDIVTDDVMKVAKTQASAIAEQDPSCPVVSKSAACARLSRHLSGYRKEVRHLRVSPSAWEIWAGLDSRRRLCTLVHQSPGLGVPAQGPEHTSMIVDRSTRQLGGLGGVRTDPVGREAGSLHPEETTNAAEQILAIVGAGGDAGAVLGSELREGHVIVLQKVEGSPHNGFDHHPFGMATPGFISRGSLVRVQSPLLFVIVISTLEVGSTVAIWSHWVALGLSLATLGRWPLFVRFLRRTEALRPRTGIFTRSINDNH